MAATGAAAAAVVVVVAVIGVVSWCPIWCRTSRRRPAAAASAVVVFLIGADHQPAIMMVRALVIREARQGSPHRADRAA
jgi:hypothetical protein